MYAIRTYNHGEFFYTVSARKLTAKVMKLFKYYYRRFLVLVKAICLPYNDGEAIYLHSNTIFLILKSSMVICTLYVHITMANFSTLFRHENSELNDKIFQIILEKTSSGS